MIKLDEEALICDLAETYKIYDYRQLPPKTVAVFSCGLKEDSRIKMKISGNPVSLHTFLLANISDGIRTLLWTKTKDAEKGKNRPTSTLEELYPSKKKERDTRVFSSGENFERERQRLMKGGAN
jgi:hypothetical protein